MERRALLRPLGIPSFRLLFASTSVSSVGTLLAATALAIDIQQRTNSGRWVGLLLIADFLPTTIVGLTLGPLLDRLSRRGLMVGADAVRAVVFCALPFVSSPGAIVALAAFTGVANGFFRPAAYAGVPNLVPEEQLADANGLLQAVENLSWAIGPVAGGMLATVGGPHTAYWVNAASFVVSGVLISRIPQRMLQSAVALTKGHWQDVGEGMRTVVRSRELLAVLITWSLAMGALGAVNTSEIFLAKVSFNGGNAGFGVLAGAIGGGLVIGSLLAGRLLRQASLTLVYCAALAWMAGAFAGTAVAPNVWVGAAIAALGGIGNGVAVACNITLVQRGVSDELRGRALTVVMAVNYIVLAIAMLVAGSLLKEVGARWVWGAAAAILVFASLVGAVMTRGLAPEPSVAYAGLRRHQVGVEPELQTPGMPL